MSEIEIPGEVRAAIKRSSWGEAAFGMDVLKKHGPALVAAELERLASDLDIDSRCYTGTAKRACSGWAGQLRTRASKLRKSAA